jgi:hypothetical protein
LIHTVWHEVFSFLNKNGIDAFTARNQESFARSNPQPNLYQSSTRMEGFVPNN